MLDTQWAREWDKANNCKDIVYKLEIVEWLINGMRNLGKKISWAGVTFTFRRKTPDGRLKRIERCLAFRCSAFWIRKTKDKTNATKLIVLTFAEDLSGMKIELIERDYWRN